MPDGNTRSQGHQRGRHSPLAALDRWHQTSQTFQKTSDRSIDPTATPSQAAVAALSGQRVVGWKIAATSAVGQPAHWCRRTACRACVERPRHDGDEGPCAARTHVARPQHHAGGGGGIRVSLEGLAAGTRARLRRAGSPRRRRLGSSGDRVPDSRYDDYARVGAPQLIADCACASWLIVGEPAEADWRRLDLVAYGDHVSQRPAGRNGYRIERLA